jgi:hypothetical protein
MKGKLFQPKEKNLPPNSAIFFSKEARYSEKEKTIGEKEMRELLHFQ